MPLGAAALFENAKTSDSAKTHSENANSYASAKDRVKPTAAYKDY